MPAFYTPLLRMLKKTRSGIGVGLAACVMLGCAVPDAQRTDSASGVVTETELQRLASTRLQLAALHFEQGRAEVALGEVAQALQAYPGYVDALNLRGWIALSMQDYESANSSFLQALALRPDDSETLYNLAWLQCQQKQYAKADESFQSALNGKFSRNQPQARTWVARGMCLQQAGKVEPAWRAFEKAYEIEPGNPLVAYNFAASLFAQGHTERARFYAQRLNAGPRPTAESLWLGIRVERAMGDAVSVRQLADQLHKRFPKSKEWQRFEQGAFDD